MNPDEIKNLIQVIFTLIGPILIAHGVVTGTDWTGLTGALLALVGPVWSIVGHWNKKKVPEKSVAVSLNPGTPVAPPVGDFMTGKVVGCFLALLLAGALLSPGAAHAQSNRTERQPALTTSHPCDPLHLAPGCQQQAADDLLKELSKPFVDLANLVGADSQDAISLSTIVPELQDGHGQQCWMATKVFGEVVKAHPVPLTLKLQTDIEALRLLGMAANNLCANPHCTQVFADLASTAEAAAPVPLPIPSLHDICSKIPQISVAAPVTVPAAAPTPAP